MDNDIQWLDIDTLDPAKQGGGATTTPGTGTGGSDEGEGGSPIA